MKPLPPSQPPQAVPDNLRWRTVKVKPGLARPVLLAGRPFGCRTHHPRTRTVPCYASLEGCSLRCPWCTYVGRFTCWTPIIDFSDKKQPRKVVMGGRRTWTSLEGLQPGSVVAISRGEGERDTVLFSPLADDSLDRSRLMLWRTKVPMDIRPYIFHLWQLRELNADYGLEFIASIRTEEIEKAVRTIEEDPMRKADL